VLEAEQVFGQAEDGLAVARGQGRHAFAELSLLAKDDRRKGQAGVGEHRVE